MEIKWWYVGLIIALVLSGAISLFATSSPDGLERVAEDIGFIEEGEEEEVMEAPMPDYAISEIEDETLSASLAGLIGTVVIFLIVIGIGRALRGTDE
ncbi:MAG: PDGLE domain-containing protein [Halobacteriota archaeon]|nr:PDGLE domain-containing protein [Halobacteriota archaeon]